MSLPRHLRAQCIQMVTGLLPAAVEWIRANLDPDTLCANVCPAAALPSTLAAKPAEVGAGRRGAGCCAASVPLVPHHPVDLLHVAAIHQRSHCSDKHAAAL